jgi:putative mRNA 3-end processing factor
VHIASASGQGANNESVNTPLLQLTEHGLWCPGGDFFVDPWGQVDRALVTHAHADHARPGSRRYLAAHTGLAILRARLGPEADIETVAYGEVLRLNEVAVSFHPAGHILGSAQVRLEQGGQVAVVSGDYKLGADPTCAPFEPVKCHTFVTESTFGLPIYRWPEPADVFTEINRWWRANQEAGKPSLIYAYALGKAQRLLAGVDAAIGPLFTHGAVEKVNEAYRQSGVPLPATTYVAEAKSADWKRALIVAPPSAQGTPWLRRFGSLSSAFASGWMRIRGTRRRRAVDRGFVLSDHADWSQLGLAIAASGAETVWVTHGYVAPLVRWLRERGLDAQGLKTEFTGEVDEPTEPAA